MGDQVTDSNVSSSPLDDPTDWMWEVQPDDAPTSKPHKPLSLRAVLSKPNPSIREIVEASARWRDGS